MQRGLHRQVQPTVGATAADRPGAVQSARGRPVGGLCRHGRLGGVRLRPFDAAAPVDRRRQRRGRPRRDPLVGTAAAPPGHGGRRPALAFATFQEERLTKTARNSVPTTANPMTPKGRGDHR